MEKMKFYTEEEIIDKHIGKKGTLARDKFEEDLQSFLIGEAIKKSQTIQKSHSRRTRKSDRRTKSPNLPHRKREKLNSFHAS